VGICVLRLESNGLTIGGDSLLILPLAAVCNPKSIVSQGVLRLQANCLSIRGNRLVIALLIQPLFARDSRLLGILPNVGFHP
jgi:hypothetical protein